MKVKSIDNVSAKDPTFDDIKDWYNTHLAPDVIDFDDQNVYEYVYHPGRWAGIFQCTSTGAQRFFIKARPKSIIDIASLTSIYRPGPLAANVDKLWLQHEEEHYDWGHELINSTLDETRGLLVFQEGVMALANKVSGFPLNECDQVRRAIMKRSISGGEEARKKTKELEESIIQGAITNGVPDRIAQRMYETICFMSGYGFNKSHAVAYAIDSYWCAWLMTYYEQHWLSAYLESMSGNDDSRAKAFSEVRALGYEIVPIDIKHASKAWTVLDGKKLMPSLVSCKGVGISAAEELETLRPFNTLEELLWDDDGKWRCSKFNKRAFEGLIKVGAFDSLDCVGEGKLFKNYHHMYRVVIENMNDIKKRTKKEPHKGRKRFFELIRELADTPPWTRLQRIEHSVACFGTADVNAMVGSAVQKRLLAKGVRPIDEYDGKDVYWFCMQSYTAKKTRNGRSYAMVTAVGPSGKACRMFMWGWDGRRFEPYTAFVGEVSRSEFGFATSQKKVRILDV